MLMLEAYPLPQHLSCSFGGAPKHIRPGDQRLLFVRRSAVRTDLVGRAICKSLPRRMGQQVDGRQPACGRLYLSPLPSAAGAVAGVLPTVYNSFWCSRPSRSPRVREHAFENGQGLSRPVCLYRPRAAAGYLVEKLPCGIFQRVVPHNGGAVPASSRFILPPALKAFFAARTHRAVATSSPFSLPHSATRTVTPTRRLLTSASGLPRSRAGCYRSMLKPYLVHLFSRLGLRDQTRIPLGGFVSPLWGSSAPRLTDGVRPSTLRRSAPDVVGTAEAFRLLPAASLRFGAYLLVSCCEPSSRARPQAKPLTPRRAARRPRSDLGSADSWPSTSAGGDVPAEPHATVFHR